MAEIDLGLVKGEKGDPGEKGERGIQGPIGPVGPSGIVDGDTPVEFEEAATMANIESGETISTIFGKNRKIFTDLLTGAGSTLIGGGLTASRALVSNANGKVAVSSVTETELDCLDGVTKNIQEQFSELNGKMNWNGIANKPSTFPPSAHNHDDRYYTKTEVNKIAKWTALSSYVTGATAFSIDKKVFDTLSELMISWKVGTLGYKQIIVKVSPNVLSYNYDDSFYYDTNYYESARFSVVGGDTPKVTPVSSWIRGKDGDNTYTVSSLTYYVYGR